MSRKKQPPKPPAPPDEPRIEYEDGRPSPPTPSSGDELRSEVAPGPLEVARSRSPAAPKTPRQRRLIPIEDLPPAAARARRRYLESRALQAEADAIEGEAIRAAMEACGWRLRTAADALGVAHGSLLRALEGRQAAIGEEWRRRRERAGNPIGRPAAPTPTHPESSPSL